MPVTDRPRPSFRRRSAKSAAIRKAGMPFTVTTREGMVSRGGFYPSGLRAGSLAHAVHTVPRRERALDGHCECHGAVTRESVTLFVRRRFESTGAFATPRIRAWD